MFHGKNARALNREEEMYREQIRSHKMPQWRSDRLLAKLDTSKPFNSRLEFIELLAALSRKYENEVRKMVTGANKELRAILWSQHSLSTHLHLFVGCRIHAKSTP